MDIKRKENWKQGKNMKELQKKNRRLEKVIAIAAGSILGVILLVVITACILVNSCLDKVNYDNSAANLPAESLPKLREGRSLALKTDVITETTASCISQTFLCDKDVFNVLLIGSDSRTGDSKGRSDSIILISVNKEASKIIATSFLRDIYLQIPGMIGRDRLNAAYAMGGAELLRRTIEENFRIKVENYIAVDFFSFMTIIDKLGGITIDVSEAELEVANNYIYELNMLLGMDKEDGLLSTSGTQALNGKQALGYARIRYVGNADFQRTDRQRLILEQIFFDMKEQSVIQLVGLVNDILPNISTNLTKSELFLLLRSVPSYAKYAQDSWRIPIDGSFSYLTAGKMSVLEIDFEQNIAELKKRNFDVPNTFD